MPYLPEFNGWIPLSLSDLLVAYRKAKADCHYENSFPTAIKFAEYEQNLLENLSALLDRIKDNKGFSNEENLLGECRLVPKKLDIQPKPQTDKKPGHAHFSDPDRAFAVLKGDKDIVPEFRIVGDFPVDTHVISALWINMIGHKFDACLDDCCYGSRLRRIRNEEVLDKQAKRPFHITLHTSFAPYFQPYKKWRNDGLNAIRNELKLNRKIIAVSLDLRSYYHLIDPCFLSNEGFREEIGLKGVQALNEEELKFTKEFSSFLQNWATKASVFAADLQSNSNSTISGGLVIGLTATRVISNILLHKWDRLLKEKLTPIHYGRYVDDMFLVLHDPGNINSSKDLLEFIQHRLGNEILKVDKDDIWEINLGKEYQANSKIQLQAGKQKLFILEGQGGLDLMDSIEKEIVELSSERRLMPSPDQIEHSTAARVLSAAGEVGEQADTLRRADGLTIRRLSWSLQLRHVETLADDLPAAAWKSQRDEFYVFAHNHILRPEKLFAHYNYLPRLLGFAIGLNEWGEAEAIFRRAIHALKQLEEVAGKGSNIVINGTKCQASEYLWQYATGSLIWTFIDAAAKNYPVDMLFEEMPKKRARKLAKVFMDQLWQELQKVETVIKFDVDSGNFHQKAPLLALTDLARKPYKQIIACADVDRLLTVFDKKADSRIFKLFSETALLDTEALKYFLKQTRSQRLSKLKDSSNTKLDSYRPYLFPTRPYTPSEIAALDPRCVGLGDLSGETSQNLWAKYVRALRGVWIKPNLLSQDEPMPTNKEKDQNKRNRPVRIGLRQKNSVVVAITNIATEDDCWEESASGKPKLTLDRYKRVAELVNQAIMLNPKPDYLIFPELSMPLKWVNSIAAKLMSNGISLIAGTEYRHFGSDEIFSEVCMELTDDRLGFPSSVRIVQPKLEPAVGEDKELTSRFGLKWKDFRVKRKQPIKPIYIHNGFYFGIMVCSELQNSKARIRFQGNVDALMILSWNKDLDTFSALVESAALDVHSYIILVNNRLYGDSRVRLPAKESFQRDIARLKGGKNDFCVAVELDIRKLRAFQSRAKRWADGNDPFKPVPEGFEILSDRRVKPPK